MWVELKGEEVVQRRPFIKLEKDGDSFSGKYMGKDTVTGQYGTQQVLRFIVKDPQNPSQTIEKLFRENADLAGTIAKAKIGDLLQITRSGSRANPGLAPDGKPFNPTTLYRVAYWNAQTPPPQRDVTAGNLEIPF